MGYQIQWFLGRLKQAVQWLSLVAAMSCVANSFATTEVTFDGDVLVQAEASNDALVGALPAALREAREWARHQGSEIELDLRRTLSEKNIQLGDKLSAARRTYESAVSQTGGNGQLLTRAAVDEIRRLEQAITKVKIKLFELEAQYTEVLLSVDPRARTLRAQLLELEQNVQKARIEGSQARLAELRANYETLQREYTTKTTEVDLLMSRFDQYRKRAASQGHFKVPVEEKDIELVKACEKLQKAWEPFEALQRTIDAGAKNSSVRPLRVGDIS